VPLRGREIHRPAATARRLDSPREGRGVLRGSRRNTAAVSAFAPSASPAYPASGTAAPAARPGRVRGRHEGPGAGGGRDHRLLRALLEREERGEAGRPPARCPQESGLGGSGRLGRLARLPGAPTAFRSPSPCHPP